MSDQQTTDVVGYFNANPYPIYIEISDFNFKMELKPGQYIRDRNRLYVNDPIFEDYVRPKGLSKSVSDKQLPIRYLARVVQSARPVHAVTEAQGFVRQEDGTVVPAYRTAPQTVAADVPVNKVPILGMTMDKARQLGLVGKPRVLSEDYGAPETTGAPSPGRDLPSIKYSLESPPKIQTAAPLTPQLMEADQRLTPAQIAQRTSIQQSLSRAAASSSPESFDPASRSAVSVPRPIVAPSEPTRMTPGVVPVPRRAPEAPAAPPEAAAKAPVERILPRRVAMVAEPVQEAEPGQMPDPDLEPPEEATQPGEPPLRFVCAADGRGFRYRSELERHVKRKYPQMVEDLMRPYPAEG